MLRADFFPGLEGKACRRQGCFRLSANGILVSDLAPMEYWFQT